MTDKTPQKNQNSTINSLKNDISLLSKIGIDSIEINKKDIENYSINDLNNCIGADRKLVINNKEEFWVHDDILTYNSQYFLKLLITKEICPLKTTEEILEGKKVYRTYIEVPHPQYFLIF